VCIYVTGGEQQSPSALSYDNRIRLPAVQRHSRFETSTRENRLTSKQRLSEFRACLADTADPWGQQTIGVASHTTEQKRTIQTSTPSSQHDSILAHHLIHKRSLNHIREANSFNWSDLYEFYYSYPVPARHGFFLLFSTTQHYSFVLLLIYT
jgi:hypothetical protein